MKKNTKKKIFKKQSGFTLIETIVYLALIGMIFTTFISLGLKVTEIRNKNFVVEEVESNARLTMDYISERIKEAKSVSVPLKGSSGEGLVLDLGQVDDNMIFGLIDGVLAVTLGEGETVLINSTETRITQLEFSNLSQGENSDSIKIYLTIEFRNSSSNDFSFSQTLETTVSLRL